MALIKNGAIVSPTVDTLPVADMESVTLEPGLYYVTGSKTIDSQTESIWNVTCIGTITASNPVCYMQVWVPASSSGLTQANQNMYVRTINSAGTGYGSFTTFVNKEYLNTNGAINKTGNPLEIYAQNTQPSATAGKTIIWIDTSN